MTNSITETLDKRLLADYQNHFMHGYKTSERLTFEEIDILLQNTENFEIIKGAKLTPMVMLYLENMLQASVSDLPDKSFLTDSFAEIAYNKPVAESLYHYLQIAFVPEKISDLSLRYLITPGTRNHYVTRKAYEEICRRKSQKN